MGTEASFGNPCPDRDLRSEACAEAWSRRCIEAGALYQELRIGSPEMAAAVSKGLQDWAASLPLRGFHLNGKPAPANHWGLEPEIFMVEAIRSELITGNKHDLEERLGAQLQKLLMTIEALDQCCMTRHPELKAEQRLVSNIRLQAKNLSHLLRQTSCATDCKAKKSRRSAVSTPQRQAQDEQLALKWETVRGRGGLSRKEFADQQGLPYDEFLKALDRWRKRAKMEV